MQVKFDLSIVITARQTMIDTLEREREGGVIKNGTFVSSIVFIAVEKNLHIMLCIPNMRSSEERNYVSLHD